MEMEMEQRERANEGEHGKEVSVEKVSKETDAESCDQQSVRGRFGWAQLELKDIPYLIRSEEVYVSVRMAERYLSPKSRLDKTVYQGAPVDSSYLTEAEIRLLNEINLHHCEAYYGLRLFTHTDRIVKLSDAVQFSHYVNLCYDKLVDPHPEDDVCGFVKIDDDYVPYSTHKGEKVVPFFYFEGDTTPLKVKTFHLRDWPLFYLKFCFRVQGIRSRFFDYDSIVVARVRDIKNHFPPGTTFEYKWPPQKDIAPLLKNDNAEIAFADCIRKPVGSPLSMTPEMALRVFDLNEDGSMARTNCPLASLLMNNAISITQQPSQSGIIPSAALTASFTPTSGDVSQANISETDNLRQEVGNAMMSLLTAHSAVDSSDPGWSGSFPPISEPSATKKRHCDTDNSFVHPKKNNGAPCPKTNRKKSTRRYCSPPQFAALIRS